MISSPLATFMASWQLIANQVVLFPNNPPWKFLFLFAVWMIWKFRNHIVFRNKNMSPNLAKEINQNFPIVLKEEA